jgi:hypothetical protein
MRDSVGKTFSGRFTYKLEVSSGFCEYRIKGKDQVKERRRK